MVACVLVANIVMSRLGTGPAGGPIESSGPMVEISSEALAPLIVPEILLQSELPVPQ
jgi:hypothetical protein